MKDSLEILETLLQKTKEEARKICKDNGYESRITREDKNYYIITHDLHSNRVNIELDNGLVTKFNIG